jgi:hypothetical protein
VLGFNLNSFEAKMAAGNVEIDWQVEGEAHVAGYELERSFDGLHFEVLESRKGGTGLPGSRYKFTDGNRSVVFSDKPVHYRLRVTDTNGGYLYSNTVEVQPGLGISRLAPLASEGVVPMKP